MRVSVIVEEFTEAFTWCTYVMPQQIQARGGPTQATADRDHIAWFGAAAQYRCAALQIADTGYRDHHRVAGGDITADHMRIGAPGLVLDTPSALDCPGRRHPCRCAEPHHEGDRGCTHRRQVGQACRRSLGADLFGSGPVQAEVPALNEHIDGDRSAARTDGQDRCVITRTDDDPWILQIGQAFGNPVDQPELAEGTQVAQAQVPQAQVPQAQRKPSGLTSVGRYRSAETPAGPRPEALLGTTKNRYVVSFAKSDLVQVRFSEVQTSMISGPALA